jgi:hypothetical protein
MSTTNAKLAPALVKAIAETQDIHADSDNPFHKSRYASLSAHLKVLKPIFAKHGLAIVQMPVGDGESVGIKTTIMHESGEFIEAVCVIPAKEINGQQAGSVFSYLRRYALAACTGVATDDDDAETDRSARSVSVSTTATAKYIPNTTTYSGPQPSQPSSGGDSGIIVPFGKHKGKSIAQVAGEDRGYIEWLASDGEKGYTPKPYNGRISPKDLALKQAAKDVLRGGGSSQQEDSNEDVPF